MLGLEPGHYSSGCVLRQERDLRAPDHLRAQVIGPSATGLDSRALLRGSSLVFFMLVLPLTIAVALIHPTLLRPALFLALLPALVAVALRAPSGLVYGLAVWVVVLGLVRRLLDTTGPVSHGGLGDPLLLVEPVILLILTVVAHQRGAFHGRTRLANAVLVLTVLVVVEAANPAQGSPLVGIGGWLFLLVPMLAFWVGRALVDDQLLRRLFLLIATLAVGAVVYGLFQQYRGLPSWDQAWVQASGYASLRVGSALRPFGTFSSASEYATFLGIGVIVCAAGMTRRLAIPALVAIGGLLCFGLFYESSRGILILAAAALAILWAARRGFRAVPALCIGAIGVLGLLGLAGHFSSNSPAPLTAQAALAQHQLQGLANPLNSKDSTLSVHFSEMVSGLQSSITDPFGQGTGAVTLAASRYGGSAQGTEVDPSNMGVALGLLGFLSYLVVAAVGLWTAYRVAAIRRSWWALASLGLLVVTFLQWTNGGQYAVAWLPWLVLGWADRVAATEEMPTNQAQDVPVAAAAVSAVSAVSASRPGARPIRAWR